MRRCDLLTICCHKSRNQFQRILQPVFSEENTNCYFVLNLVFHYRLLEVSAAKEALRLVATLIIRSPDARPGAGRNGSRLLMFTGKK
jgi:hypothetical protein